MMQVLSIQFWIYTIAAGTIATVTGGILVYWFTKNRNNNNKQITQGEHNGPNQLHSEIP